MKTWIQRITPFLLTFALGLLVASFFVSLRPSQPFNRYKAGTNYCKQRRDSMRNYESYKCPSQIRRENEQAREEWRNRRAFSDLNETSDQTEIPGTVKR